MKKIHINNLLYLILFLGIAVAMITGQLQKVIHFKGVENEMAVIGLSVSGVLAFSFGVKK